MWQVLTSAWALLLGICLLMIGNGMQGTMLGIRGGIEEFSTFEMSIVMSAYFVGFLGGSRLAPGMIRRVGHVRVFSALASMISAVIILYPAAVDVWVWTLGRVLIGFCFSAVYVTAESWLNNASTNENRGQSLSLYMIVQTLGVVISQSLLVLADPSGYVLFVIPSILVSLAITPILLSISPTPAFAATKPMSLAALVKFSPLGSIGMFFVGGVFSAQFGMASVYGAAAGFSVGQISTFVATFFVGALLLQFPIGWLSDRLDRRRLIVAASTVGFAGAVIGLIFAGSYTLVLLSAFVAGGMSNPLYSLLVAHTNDHLEHDDMTAAAGGLLFINGLGAISAPVITGFLMERVGPEGFFMVIGGMFACLGLYATYRATRRDAVPIEETGAYVAVTPSYTPVAMETAQEYAIETEMSEPEVEDGRETA
jgi:MFS family permease